MSGDYYVDCENEECMGCESVKIEYDLCESPIDCNGDSVEWHFTGECSVCGHTHTLAVYGNVHTFEVHGD